VQNPQLKSTSHNGYACKLKSDAWDASSNGSIREDEGTFNTIPPMFTALFAFHHESHIGGSTRPFMNVNATQWL
jgi:hypothetical protein